MTPNEGEIVSPVAGLSVDRDEVPLNLPAGFPPPDLPANNPLTETKIALGKRLFFDPSLSADGTVSCNSCHLQEKAFSDPRAFSLGVGGVSGDAPERRRNALALFNLAWHQTLFWDGNIEDPDGTHDLLERQSSVPIEAPHEMNSSFDLVIDRLYQDSSYVNHFYRAFGDSIRPLRIQQALASFERTMISGGSKYDRFAASGFDSTVLTPSEYRGYQLYFAETGTQHAECFHCHGGFNFDDPTGAFRNNGLLGYDYEDFGRALVTGTPGQPNNADYAKFKVPSLRNIEHTAPYLHDGSIQTLEEVLDRYIEVANEPATVTRDPFIDNIVLSEQDKEDVIAFLKTLSDPDFLTDPAFQPE
jgi:cytochrome c peroxidase